MTNAALGRLLTPPCTAQHVGRLRRRGMPADSAEAAQAWRARNLDQRYVDRAGSEAPPAESTLAAPVPPPPPGATYQEARRRHALAEAERAELALRRERGDLVELAAVQRAARAAGATCAVAWDSFVARAAAELGPGALAVLQRHADATRREIVRAIAGSVPDA